MRTFELHAEGFGERLHGDRKFDLELLRSDRDGVLLPSRDRRDHRVRDRRGRVGPGPSGRSADRDDRVPS
jgi:hypothetical protein